MKNEEKKVIRREIAKRHRDIRAAQREFDFSVDGTSMGRKKTSILEAMRTLFVRRVQKEIDVLEDLI